MPDGEIIDIFIDTRSNLPVLHDFVCDSSEFEKFGPSHAHQANAKPHILYPLTSSERLFPSAQQAAASRKPPKDIGQKQFSKLMPSKTRVSQNILMPPYSPK